MLNALLAAGVFLILFFILLLSVLAGRRFARWQLEHSMLRKLQVMNVAEGAVFALLGLLIAFTFSSAYERFEARKMRIIDEVNYIETAYQRIDLLAADTQPGIRKTFAEYMDSRIEIYRNLPDFTSGEKALAHSQFLKLQLWNQIIAACKITNNNAATMLVVPAFNNVFEIARTRYDIRLVHAPIAIFILLIGLASLSSFLAGYSTVGKHSYNFIYIVSYAAITAFTIYIIIDLELPRLGLIRVDNFDSLIVEIRNNIK
jgi:hypothetical protein